ncbi:MAG: hypothetical protein RRY53_05580, partial [Pseudoflavonifractor sp.]
LPGAPGYLTTPKLYEYQMKDKAGNSSGHLNFTGVFPQETLPNVDGGTAITPVVDFYGDGKTSSLPWDLPSFDVVTTLTYFYKYRTALANGTGPNGTVYMTGDYLTEDGNFA